MLDCAIDPAAWLDKGQAAQLGRDLQIHEAVIIIFEDLKAPIVNCNEATSCDQPLDPITGVDCARVSAAISMSEEGNASEYQPASGLGGDD